MPSADATLVAALIRRVADTIILPRFRRLGEGDAREKKPGDWVTLADVEAEEELSRQLQLLLPGSVVVGEEGVAANPGILGSLLGDEPVWLIDPIDGTRNFVHGRPRFAVMVALVMKAVTVQGWIYDPLTGRMAIAEQGGGCWLWGRKLTLSPDHAIDRPLSRLVGTVGWRHSSRIAESVARLVRHGCAGHDYLALIEDQIQFAVYRHLNPWDHAAGNLLFSEAGGTAALSDGQRYRPLPQTGTLLLAPDPIAWQRLNGLIEA